MPQMESDGLKLGGPVDYLLAIAFEEAKFNKYMLGKGRDNGDRQDC